MAGIVALSDIHVMAPQVFQWRQIDVYGHLRISFTIMLLMMLCVVILQVGIWRFTINHLRVSAILRRELRISGEPEDKGWHCFEFCELARCFRLCEPNTDNTIKHSTW